MSDEDRGFLFGVIVTSMLWSLIIGFFGILYEGEQTSQVTYQDCLEDEVWAWQHNGGDFPNDVEWGCVPIDNLLVLE